MQLIRIAIILLLIAGLDAIVYFLALKFNSYYRRRIPLSEILKKEIGKGPIKPLPSPPKAAARYKPNILRRLLLKFDTAAPLQKFTAAPKAADVKKETPPVRKFNVGDGVKFLNSRGAVKGQIISYNGNNTARCRYLVNWGKGGIQWVSEDRIELAEAVNVEIAA